MLRRIGETLLLPPASALLMLLCGLVLRRARPRTARTMMIAGVAWLWLASTPCFGGLLLQSLQIYPPLPAGGELPPADAIVVLSAGADRVGVEFGRPVIGPTTLQRLRYGIALQRRTGLPLLVSGGRPANGTPTLAEMMQHAAEHEFGGQVLFAEGRSADTSENARYSAEILIENGLRRVLLVTSAWHMPRSLDVFTRYGIEAVPAPTAFRGEAFASWTSFLPHWTGLRDTCLAMHEWGGRIIYALRD